MNDRQRPFRKAGLGQHLGKQQVGKAHLDRIGWRTFGLFGCRIAKTSPGRPHIPEVAAHQIVLTLVVVQHRSERRIGMGLRLAFAETGPDGSRV
jgi:hypothetical protein